MKRTLFSLIVCLLSAGRLAADESIFPADADIINVKNPPYNARGDGVTDDTAAIIDGLTNREEITRIVIALKAQAQSRASPSREQRSMSFGPVTERVMDSFAAGLSVRTNYLDLDTGEFVNEHPPGDLVNSIYHSDTRARVGLDIVAIAVADGRWDCSPEEVCDEVAKATPKAWVSLGGPSSRRTYLFKTHEGSMGVLQIVPLKEDESKVNIRFKRVLPAPRTSDSSVKTNEAALSHRPGMAKSDEAIKAILAYGGFVQRDPQGRVVCVNLLYEEDDQGRRRECTNRSDTIAAWLPALPDVQKLLLQGAQASDGAMQFVAQLQGLKELYMWDAMVGDKGISWLTNLQQLEYLHLNNGFISDAALEVFASLPRLEGLSLRGNHFTDEGLAFLGRMKQLKRLWLGRGDCRITDAGIKSLSELENLEELELQGHPITDEGLKHLYDLAKLRKLRRVYLHGTRVTALGVYRLSHVIPGLWVDWL